MRGAPRAPGSQPDLIGTVCHVDGMDDAALGKAGQAIPSTATNIISWAGFAAESAFFSITDRRCWLAFDVASP